MRRRACWCRPRARGGRGDRQARHRRGGRGRSRPRRRPTVGPLVSKIQFDRVERYIEKGIAEGAKLLVGGAGRPAGLSKGYYVKPTIFSDVRNDMTIAREEIFGPVLCILPYETEEQAVADRQRYALWTGGLCLVEGQRPRAARRPPHPRGPGGDQRRIGRHEDAVRRLQDVRQRPRVGRVRPARLPRGQGGDRRRRRLTPAEHGGREPPSCGSRILSKRYRQDRPADFRAAESRTAARRVPRHHGRVGRRQIDAAQSAGRPR